MRSLPQSLLLAAALGLPHSALAADERPLRIDDLFALKDVADPRLSPDGRSVAYTVTTLDAKADASDSDVYLSPLEGGEPLRLTSSKKGESRPRFSPDGEWIAFLSSREGDKAQVFLLSRRGGEAVKLTDYKASVEALAWSPDSKRLALVVSDEDPDAPAEDGQKEKTDKDKKKTAKPIVVKRLQFMSDGDGYLKDVRSHIHVFDVAAKKSLQLTSGPFDDSSPAWSPDSARLAFVSNRTLPDSDHSVNTDIFTVAAREGEIPHALTTSPARDSSPVWSPDGQSVAFVEGGDPKDLWYGSSHVAVIPAAGGTPRALTASLDRNVSSPRFAPDGRAVLFLLEDGGNQHLAKVGLDGGAVERVVAGERDVRAFDVATDGTIAVLETTPQQPAEISRVGKSGLERVTHVNDAFLKGIKLAGVERFKATSKDGTPVDGFLTLPAGETAKKLPTILRIHGGPASQYSTAFNLEWQMLAAYGYAVVSANPRGSTGYGTAYSRAIWADWGHKDFEDVMAAVDAVVAKGVADPDRLGVGGWSYGGMLTDHVITKTTRFKAAITGASIANILAGYGTDHYQYHYEVELGLPWKDRERWLAVSTPFFDVEKVETPTLVVCGQLDMNVPLINSEQLYQALRRVGKVETELVIYPNQWHGIRTPSYQKDRYERYLAWYDRFLRPGVVTAARSGTGKEAAKPEATSLLGRPLFAPPLASERQKALEADLTKATADFLKDPGRADSALWLGRRYAYLGRYQDAIDAFTRGLAAHSDDARLLRQRGHRYITTRQYDKAQADLTRAAELVKGKRDEPEPGADPTRPATTTLQYQIYYHLGLAHYLKGDFASAEKAYRRCLETARGNDESLVGVTDWLYMTLRREGKDKDAAQLIEPVNASMKAGDSRVYLNRLLMYKGVYTPEDLLRAGGDGVARATYGYAVGNFALVNGHAAEARAAFEQVVSGEQWIAFGFAAAEAELARSNPAPTRQASQAASK